MKTKIIIFMLIISIILNLITIAVNLDLDLAKKNDIKKELSENSINISDDFYNCTNKEELNSTVMCWRDTIRSFHNYTHRNDTIKSIEDIKKNGGDCYDYSYLYKRLADKKGYRSKVIYLNGTNSIHAFITIWDNNLTKYCNIDQLTVDCLKFKK